MIHLLILLLLAAQPTETLTGKVVGVTEQTERANGQVWVTAKVLQHLGPTWRLCFAA